MSVQDANAYPVYAPDVTNAVPSAARTASGSSSAVDVGPGFFGELALLLEVTAVSGTTPSGTFTVEWSHDGTAWFVADPSDSMGAAITTANTRRVKTFTIKGRFWRLVWAITGTTPSLTFAGHAHYNA